MARQTQVRPVNRVISMQRAHLARELVETLLLLGLIFVIVHFTIQSFSVGDSSMGTALQPSQTVLVNTKAFIFGGPSRGDVVVLTTDPADPEATMARRVVAVPGDTVMVSATAIIVNGVTLKEPYIEVPPGSAQNSTLRAATKLGPDQYFVVADNRLGTDSTDSRGFGPVPRNDLIGKAVVVFWPLSQFHWIDTHSDIYSKIPNP
ncbi:MAG TPA: signal peptidase I [Ktedonobacterales bacterium]